MLGFSIILISALCASDSSTRAIDFNRDVRPILTSNCLRCHGGVRELGGVNLGDRERALSPSKNGNRPIVPGSASSSEVIRRIMHTGDDRMPPTGEALTATQIETLRSWIDQGAKHDPFWSLVAPRSESAPTVSHGDWPRSPLDRFTLARMEAAGILPAQEAAKVSLLRRVSLDLIGLPPSPKVVETFLADDRPDAYERIVDGLLHSEHFGERWARVWLDLARYADTQGYEKDQRRSIWLWRDWLISALQDDMPYDEFVTRMIAGDLLPNANEEDQIATAFHSNTLTNAEGGTDDEEFRLAAVIDRVSVTWQAFMGTTFQCAQCHSHPYDSFAHREYYEFLAFFNQSEDSDQNDERPTIMVRPPHWRTRALDAVTAMKRSSIDDGAFATWIERVTADEASAEVPEHLRTILLKPVDQRDGSEHALLVLASKRSDPVIASELASLAPASVPVMRELRAQARRETRVLDRGSLKSPLEVVEPRTPRAMHSWPDGAPRDRLGLAQWMTRRENPLFARVAVNRLWETLFGRGIVETCEDFGSQGSAPTDHALLDHLAVRLPEVGWSTKRMLREIVLSATYRQSVVASPETLRVDPENRLWSRSPRYRLEAEVVRDSVLAVSELLSPRRFGPSVMPRQPDGIWQVVYSGDEWTTSAGDDAYRRSIYTFWRRSSPYPAMIAFDAPSREVCSVRRIRTNTPIAALASMNDPVWIEAARSMAKRAMASSESETMIATRLLQRALARDPERREVERLLALHTAELARFAQDPTAAVAITGDPAGNADWAAWTTVASAILNLDEFLTRG